MIITGSSRGFKKYESAMQVTEVEKALNLIPLDS